MRHTRDDDAGSDPWRKARHGLIWGLAWLLAMIGHAALAAVAVPVRASTHDTFGRIVFDWPEAASVSPQVDGNQLLIRFDKELDSALGILTSALSGYVAAARIGEDRKTVLITLKKPVTVKNFKIGNRIVLDLSADPKAPAFPAPASAASPPSPPPQPAATPPQARSAGVTIRAGTHDSYNRLVFDWSQNPNYSVNRSGENLTVFFDRSAKPDFAAVTRLNPPLLKNLAAETTDSGSLAVRLNIPADAVLRHFKKGNAVVLDVLKPHVPLPPETTATNPPPPPPAGTAAPPTPTPVPAATPPAATTPPPAAATTPPATTPPAAPAAAAGAGAAPRAAPQPTGQPATTPVGTPTARPGATAGVPGSLTPSTAPPPASVTATPTAFTFNLPGPAAAAIYARAGYLYAVFDKPVDTRVPTLSGPVESLVGPIETVATQGGSGFRIAMPPWLRPFVEKDGNQWRVILARSSVPPPQGLAIEPQPDFLGGPRLLVRTADPTPAITLTDPEIGDRLMAVPLPMIGRAVTERQHYAQLEFMPALQGIVVRPIIESIQLRPARDGVEITAAGGLRLSPSTEAKIQPSTQAASPIQERRLFEIENWQRGKREEFTPNRQKLQSAIIDAPENLRSQAMMELARFYFAHGYGPETLGLLAVLQTGQPDLENWPEFRAIRGASKVLAYDPEGAMADLAIGPLDNNPEAALWRGAAAAGRRDWPTASREFSAGAGLLPTYPDPHFVRLILAAIESKLNQGERPDAVRFLDQMVARHPDAEHAPAVLYFRGEALRQAGNGPRAAELWKEAADSPDRYYRSRAAYALINLEVAEGRMPPTTATEKLEGLRFAWRGDDYELDVLQRVGEMHMLAGNYFDGLRVMRETIAYFPDHPRNAQLTEEMTRLFTNLYLREEGSPLSALDALALYDEFRELTPVGAQGDAIIRHLAERLVEIDLLERASQLLQHQVEFRLSGLDKLKVGTRLAAIRLLDGKYEQAIKALDLSVTPNPPADLEGERRALRARALVQLNRIEEAMTLLGNDESRPATLMRVDIAWRNQRWAQAAAQLAKVIGPPPAAGQKLDDDATQLVINRAVALSLAGDAPGLAQMRAEFTPAMELGPEANTFAVLTRPQSGPIRFDAGSIRSRVAEVDLFQNFLNNYRKKPSGSATSGGTSAEGNPGTPTPAAGGGSP